MTKIAIKDLKGVGDVELNLDSKQRVFTFLGTNGVGKTKTLESLLIYFLVQQKDFVSSYKNFIYANMSSLLATSVNYNGVFLNFNKKFPNDYIEQFIETKKYALAYLGANYRGNLSDTKFPNQNFENNELNKSLREYFEHLIFLIIHDRLSEFSMDRDIHQWFVERAKSVNPYQIEKDNSQTAINSVLKCLHKIDNAFDENFLRIDENNHVYLKIDNKDLELSELSSGFLSLVKIIQSIIASYSAFANEKDLLNIKGIVLIDEIESHLHLEWQVKIIPILKDLFPNTTFYITTHSPLVLSQLNEGEAYLLKRDNDGVVRSEIINSPNTRLLENVLQDAFGVNLNQLKRENMENIDQSKAKKKLLDLLNSQASS